jgi:hypothetical protein
MAAQAAEDENDSASWKSLMASSAPDGTIVNFSRPAVGMGGLRDRPQHVITNHAANGTLFGSSPAYHEAAAGQVVRSVQPPRPNASGQKTPHIIT